VDILDNSQIISIINLHIINMLTLRGTLVIIMFKIFTLRTLDRGALVSIVSISPSHIEYRYLVLKVNNSSFKAKRNVSLIDFMTCNQLSFEIRSQTVIKHICCKKMVYLKAIIKYKLLKFKFILGNR